MPDKRQRALVLYAIIVFKLAKGALLLALALGFYTLSDNNLPVELANALDWLHINPERKFFSELAAHLQTVTPTIMLRLASGAFLYSLFDIVEGIGLSFRAYWAGWLAIGQSAFFIPIEVYELGHKWRWGLAAILVINVAIVWYLYRNKERLLHHHHHGHAAPEKA